MKEEKWLVSDAHWLVPQWTYTGQNAFDSHFNFSSPKAIDTPTSGGAGIEQLKNYVYDSILLKKK